MLRDHISGSPTSIALDFFSDMVFLFSFVILRTGVQEIYRLARLVWFAGIQDEYKSLCRAKGKDPYEELKGFSSGRAGA